jgi:Tol biopolymer transport system component
LSPDGRTLILKQASMLAVRSLDSKVLRPLPTTTGDPRTPFFSPDGRTIAFFHDGMLKTLSLAGGPPQILCRDTGVGYGGTWNEDGTILFATSVAALKRVRADGGDCTDVSPSEAGVRAATLPEFLPDGRHFLYVREVAERRSELFVASLDEPRGHRLLADASSAQFLPDHPSSRVGYLLFRREGKLVAQPFDANAVTLSGDPVVVADAVGTTNAPPQMAAAVSRTGTIVYVANGQPERQLIWYDRVGKELRRSSNTGIQGSAVSLSPDGRMAAFMRSDSQLAFETRLLDLETNQDRRFFAPPLAPSVVWSPDSSRVAFAGVVDGTLGIYARLVTGGTPELLLRGGENQRTPSDWSHDGRALFYTDYDPKTRGDIWLLPISRAPTPVAILRTPANETEAQLSPDGKWLAYASDESGTTGVYLRAFTGGAVSGGARLASATAMEPRWRADGKELFYVEVPVVAPRRRMMAIAIGTDFDHLLGTPRLLFEFSSVGTIPELNRFQYSPAADGQRFLVNAHATDAPPSVDVLLNWPASVRNSR